MNEMKKDYCTNVKATQDSIRTVENSILFSFINWKIVF